MFSHLLQLAGLAKRWPTYTREEVAVHNTPRSLWIVAGTTIYDVTSLLGEHAGGDQALLRRGGGVRDCTEDLHFHSRASRKEAESYKVGELVPSPPPLRPERGGAAAAEARLAKSLPATTTTTSSSSREGKQPPQEEDEYPLSGTHSDNMLTNEMESEEEGHLTPPNQSEMDSSGGDGGHAAPCRALQPPSRIAGGGA